MLCCLCIYCFLKRWTFFCWHERDSSVARQTQDTCWFVYVCERRYFVMLVVHPPLHKSSLAQVWHCADSLFFQTKWGYTFERLLLSVTPLPTPICATLTDILVKENQTKCVALCSIKTEVEVSFWFEVLKLILDAHPCLCKITYMV